MAKGKTPTAGAEGATVKARVLCAGPFGQVDDVVEVDADLAAEHSDLDPHPDAVAYAEALKPAPEPEAA